MRRFVGLILAESGSGESGAEIARCRWRFEDPPGYDNYCAALRSERRRDLAREASRNLLPLVEAQVEDRLTGLPELARYACFAGDAWMQGSLLAAGQGELHLDY